MISLVDSVIDKIRQASIPVERKNSLSVLVDIIQRKVDNNLPIRLNYICTHNSRRSQFAQIWSQVAASNYGIEVQSYSGGVEVTAFNERAISSLKRVGFEIEKKGEINPHYFVKWSNTNPSLEMFSKVYDDPINPSDGFTAIMTCSHADENCPFVSGCEQRIALRYYDPKEFDDTPFEEKMYDERSLQIAAEMFYVFSQIKK